ncbi:ATP-dependent DNA helicase PIF1 [Favolaschia claudopus]|uniref:U4/U6 snRNA-associated-splicing factor PRP24 n=1 Tax=Favolaschia claudopus TaxID=2862362 RepID=A0AAW0DAI9_9AGAR
MEESQSLDALSNILTQLETKPFDLSLHAAHIRLTQSLEGLQPDALAAMEMMSSFYAVGEDLWLALIQAKENAVHVNTANGVEELLALYRRAEEDYFSIPLLKQHAEFIISRCEQYAETEKPQELGELFSADWTRQALEEIVSKGIWHMTQSHLLWDQLRDWELQTLSTVSEEERPQAIVRVEELFLARLGQPHATSEDTAQAYSTFTTNYRPNDDYESLLIKASKIRGQAAKVFQRRETWETSLQSATPDTFALYIASERRAKNPSYPIISTLYERAIADAAKRRFSGEQGAEEALRVFWAGYCDTARTLNAGLLGELEILQRAVRSVPGSGEVWARYIRCLERAEGQDEASVPSISEIYDKALSTNLLQSDVEQLVPVLLARAGYDKRQFEATEGDEDRFITMVAMLEAGLDLVRKASPTGDPRLRLEKYLTSIYNAANMADSVIEVWSAAAKHYKTSYNTWICYTDALIKYDRHDKARKTFVDLHLKNLDWPEAIWEAWLAFEHLHGTVEQIEACGDKLEKAQFVVSTRRAKAAEKQSAQYAAEQMASIPVAEAPVPQTSAADPMDVDSEPRPRGTKRAAEDTASEEGHKKARIDSKPTTLKRDRENSTVFVADLPTGVTEEELNALFKDCGKVREVKITELTGAIVATVEFFERDSVPAALTKDKKRIREQEVAVHLAWKSTLYVTNFPESADDKTVRELFGRYGVLFDVRWPSKKYKSTRRFCYIQFTSPTSAQNALELHGRELEPGIAMNVFISNPERKKERTDQDADERELYVAGLSKFTTKEDLEKLFKPYGSLKGVRMALDKDNHSKGFAFVEFEDEKSAQAALEANNQELKKRRIAVTLADSRRSKKNVETESGLGRKDDARSRSVRVRNLPDGTQEGLLQQAMEKIAKVKRVEVFADVKEAVVELENAAEASKLLLQTKPVVFNGNTLKLSEESTDKAALKSEGAFVPRAAKPRAGLGHRKPVTRSSALGNPAAVASGSQNPPPAPAKGKGQDDFRKMLG